MESRARQFGRLHPVRIHVLQTANEPRLAFVRRIQRISRRPIHRNVWFSTYHLFPVGMAPEPLSKYRLVLARRRPSFGDDVRLENEPTCGTLPYSELCFHRRRLHPDLGGLARALRRPTTPAARNERTLCPCSASAVHRVHSDHVRLPAAVADPAHARDVPRA